MSSVASAVNTQALYRLYNADGELLYIGISKSALVRLTQHLDNQPWADEIATVKIERHPVTRASIEEMEREAIAAERPRYNKMHNRGYAPQPQVTRLHTFDHFAPATRWAPNEYKALRLALDDFADATASYLQSQGDVLGVLRDMVAAWAFADMHHECTHDDLPPVQYPISRNDTGYCVYICNLCGQPWKCWYR